MKKHELQNRWIAFGLIITLLLLTAAAAQAEQAAPLLPTDVTWAMTPDEVMEKEGMSGTDTTEAFTETGTRYEFTYQAEGDEPERMAVYVFKAGQLVMYGGWIDPAYQAMGTDDTLYYYNVLLGRLTEMYGEPAEEQTAVMAILEDMVSSALENGSFKGYELWDLGDGTGLFLETTDAAGTSYTFINTPVLYESAFAQVNAD